MDRPIWWVFKMRSGAIEKFYGTALRERGDTFEVYNENIMTGFVSKSEVVDRWAQDQQTSEREK